MKEKHRLVKLFEKDPAIEKLIDEAAFLSVTLEETRMIINRDGVIETYMNGASQWGQKKSAAVEVYDKNINNYMKLMKQLYEIGHPDGFEKQDDFMKAIKGSVR